MRRWPVRCLLVVALTVSAACGDHKPSDAECANEAAKLFQSVKDLDKINEKIQALEKKGCRGFGTGKNSGGPLPGLRAQRVAPVGAALAANRSSRR